MSVKLLMTACGSSSDMIAMHGIDKQKFITFRNYTMGADDLTRFRKRRNGGLVGARLAARYGWKRGDNVTLEELGNVSFVVSGIFTTHGSPDDFIIFAGRRFIQEATDEQGIGNHIIVKLNEGADPDQTSKTIDELPMTIDTLTQPEEAHLAVALDQLSDLAKISKLVIAVIIMVILIAMGNAFSMVTRERSHEFAVFRTLGYSKGSVLILVLGEGIILSLAGGILGCTIVQTLINLNLVKTVASCSFTISLVAGPTVWLKSLSAVMAAGVLGCLLPALSVSRLNIVKALRRED